MSDLPHPSGPATSPPPAPGGGPPGRREIKLVSHSTIFYWWPIWVLGYVLALITYFEDHRLAIIPAGTKFVDVKKGPDDRPTGYTIEAPGDTRSLDRAAGFEPGQAVPADWHPGKAPGFKPRISQKEWMGPVYCVVLLLTILITNVPLRGLW